MHSPSSGRAGDSKGLAVPRPRHVSSLPEPPPAFSARLLPALTDGDGGHDEGVPEEECGGLGRQVAAEILQKQVLLRLLLGTSFGSHGRAGAGSREGSAGAKLGRDLWPRPHGRRIR